MMETDDCFDSELIENRLEGRDSKTPESLKLRASGDRTGRQVDRRPESLADPAPHRADVIPIDVARKRDRSRIFGLCDWLKLDLSVAEHEVLVGSRTNAIIRPLTKNLVVGQEKSFKTSFMLRLAMGLSSGETVFPELPVVAPPQKILYLHGELSEGEIKERTVSAAVGFEHLENFFQGKDLEAHLIENAGQKALEDLVARYRPQVFVIDPWQSFISGHDENSFEAVSRAQRFLDDLIDKYGITVFLPVHLGKVAKRGARGHSSLAGWRDTLIELTKTDSNLTVKVEPRWAKAPAPFSLVFRDGTLWSGGAPVWSGQTGKIRAFVETQGGSTTREAVGRHLGISGDALRKALGRAREAIAVVLVGEEVALPRTSD